MSIIEKKDSKVIQYSLIILTVIASVVSLHILKPVLVPCVFSLFFYFIIAPFVESMHDNFRCPRWLTVLITMIVLVCAFVGLTVLLGMSMRMFIADSDLYAQKIIGVIEHITTLLTNYGFTVKIDQNFIENNIQNLPIIDWVKHISRSIFEIIANLFLILLLTFFLVSGKREAHYRRLLDKELQTQIRRYLATKFIISVLIGVLTGLVLNFMGLQLALLIALLTFVLNFIPNIGSIVSTLLPFPVALLQFGYSVKFLSVVLIVTLLHFCVGNILDPKLMGMRMGLHPAVVLLCLLFWGFIWGIPGMFLAVPVTSILKLLLSRSEHTLFISKLMEGEFKL